MIKLYVKKFKGIKALNSFVSKHSGLMFYYGLHKKTKESLLIFTEEKIPEDCITLEDFVSNRLFILDSNFEDLENIIIKR